MRYRDLGASGASNGRIRAQVMSAITGMARPTGGHHHVCAGQFVYTLKDWLDLEFDDGTALRLGAGGSLFIPRDMRHDETAASADLEILELPVSAEMGTAPCDPPPR